MTYRKKLIEVALPLKAINEASVREKSIRHGHPSTLHLWWARRPLATCRAVLFASLVDDPSEHPEEFPTEQDQERERDRLFKLIEQLVRWENSNNQEVLSRVKAEIFKSTGGNPPPVRAQLHPDPAREGNQGVGKRVRKTVFTPFAQDTVRVYEEHVRPHFPDARTQTALFLTESGERISYKAMWHNLHVITQEARKAGLDMPPKLSWHSLRKSFATNFMEQHPERPWVLMDLLGHLNPSTLHRYVKHSRAYYDQAIEEIVGAMVAEATAMQGAG